MVLLEICRALSVALGFEKQMLCPSNKAPGNVKQKASIMLARKQKYLYCMACHKQTFGNRTSWMQGIFSSFLEKFRTAGPLKPEV